MSGLPGLLRLVYGDAEAHGSGDAPRPRPASARPDQSAHDDAAPRSPDAAVPDVAVPDAKPTPVVPEPPHVEDTTSEEAPTAPPANPPRTWKRGDDDILPRRDQAHSRGWRPRRSSAR